MQLAELNIARLKYPLDDPRVADLQDGRPPSLAGAAERLNDLTENGPSARAFGWAQLTDIERWRSQRCA